MTANLKDFPDEALAPFSIRAHHPDEFLCKHLKLAQGLFCRCVQKVRARLKSPPYSAEEHLDTLERNGIVATATELRPFAGLL